MSDEIKPRPNYLEDPQLSTGTKEYLKVLNASDTPVESLPVSDARNVLFNAQKSIKVDLSGIEESEKNITADGYDLKLTIVRPEGVKDKLPVFIFVHGGGWVLGDYPTHQRLVRDLVVESGFACAFVNYTLSPEAKFPQAPNEVYAATKWVAENGDQINVDGKRLAVVGNSAGGNMTLTTSMKAKENNGPEIKCQVLMWPFMDASTDFDSYKLFGKERFLTTSLMEWMVQNYISCPSDIKSIYLSPLRASIDELKGLPPTLIEVAENDILRDGGEQMARKLDEAGVYTLPVRFNGITHDWEMLNGFAELPQTKGLVMLAASFMKKFL
ncbi:MAG: alpha/beta hydrolase [Rikenellaceae bacterium]|nr:alpha/beta hydrolase [Rikenellaceae bacterium]